jgi:hypothetical protein
LQCYSVRGFDHRAFESAKRGWEGNLFPYKLGCYSKTFLSAPCCVLQVDYSSGNFINTDSGNTWSTLIPIVRSGRCDCFVIWVDYDLTDSLFIRYLDNETADFPHHLKCLLKYFPSGIDASTSQSFMCEVALSENDASLEFDFKLI